MKDSPPAVLVQDSIAYDIYRCARVLRIHLMAFTKKLGYDITPEMWFVLNKLHWQDGQIQSELSEASFSDGPNLTRMLNTLEKNKFIHRQQDPEDGRAKRVYLTPFGKKAAATIANEAQAMREELFSELSPHKLKITRNTLKSIEDKVQI